MPTRRTPKVFHSNYRAPKPINWQLYRSLKPVLWLLVISAVIYFIGRLPVFRVEVVQVEGTDNQTIIDQLSTSKGQPIFSKAVRRNVDRLIAENLQIDELNCRRGIPDTLRCQVSLRVPAIVWRHGGKDWLVDQNGFVYGEKPVGQPIPVAIEDRGPTAVTLGTTVASSEIVSLYQKIHQQLTAKGLVVSNIFISESLYQVGVTLTSSTNPELPFAAKSPISVLMVTSYPVESQVATLVELLKTKQDQITERVDLRVPGYAYTK